MTTTSQGESLVYTAAEASKLLHLSRNSIYEAIKRHEIPSLIIGRRILVPVKALNNLLEGKTVAGEPTAQPKGEKCQP